MGINYEYPRTTGATMTLVGNIYYGDPTATSFGVEAANRSSITVRPKLNLQIEGRTADREVFWRHSQVYTSNQRYSVGGQFVLGVATGKLQGSEIFPIPLAEGVIGDLRRPMVRHGVDATADARSLADE
ncbi:MAG: hypothetical protein AAGE01_02525 [Pseudomonadota bacterium]